MNLDRAWTLGVTGFLLLLILIGGTSQPLPAIGLIQQLGGLGLFVLGVLRLHKGLPSRAAGYGLAILASGVALIGLQLLPLPPGLWTSLPGRQFVVESFAAAAMPAGWMPLSLSPPETWVALLALLPAIALFIAALTLRIEDRRFIATALVCVMVFNVLLGLGQKFQGAESTLYFYEDGSLGATGVFANRNFFAASLYIVVPVSAALAMGWASHRSVNRLVVAFFAVVLLAVLIIGLAAAASRAGIIFAMAAVLASGFLFWNRSGDDKAYSVSRLTIVAFFGALVLIAQFGLAGILRIAATDPINEYRAVIFQVSSKVFAGVFPLGSGFGTFVPIYTMFETPATMLDAYVNHAHNDWLELAIEGGVPMIVLLLTFLIWYGLSTIQLWRRGNASVDHLIQRAAAISTGLLLLHSLVDYPLRTPALMGIFALFCGLMACGPGPTVQRQRHRATAKAPISTPNSAQGVNSERRGPYFVPKDGQAPK